MRASNAGRGGRGRRKAKRRQDQREENTEKKPAERKNFPSPKNHTQGNKPEAGRGVLLAAAGAGRPGGGGEGRTDGQTDAGLLPAGGRQPLAPAGWSSTCRGPRRGGRGGSGRYAHSPPPALPAPSPPEGSRLPRSAPGLAHRPAVGSYRGPARS